MKESEALRRLEEAGIYFSALEHRIGGGLAKEENLMYTNPFSILKHEEHLSVLIYDFKINKIVSTLDEAVTLVINTYREAGWIP